ncbi:hypothetical protein GALL_437710 [mine drainage metagenome]|uniref:Uncharacterized protein n=1 Tax=mine drainage metagenome TaxID=410659 RepID=A0A1J5PSJ1_9ZZZZ
MFETYDSAEIPIPKGLSLPGARLWSYATQQLHIPWFYVQYRVTTAEYSLSSMFLFGRHEQLLELMGNPDIEVTQVYIVTPEHLNKSGHWQMDILKEISIGFRYTEHYEDAINIFTLDDGRKYYYPDYSESEKLEKVEVLFSI